MIIIMILILLRVLFIIWTKTFLGNCPMKLLKKQKKIKNRKIMIFWRFMNLRLYLKHQIILETIQNNRCLIIGIYIFKKNSHYLEGFFKKESVQEKMELIYEEKKKFLQMKKYIDFNFIPIIHNKQLKKGNIFNFKKQCM